MAIFVTMVKLLKTAFDDKQCISRHIVPLINALTKEVLVIHCICCSNLQCCINVYSVLLYLLLSLNITLEVCLADSLISVANAASIMRCI